MSNKVTPIKVKCISCGSSILYTTAITCDGLCMPCYKKESYCLAPSKVSYIEEYNLHDIFVEYIKFYCLPFPRLKDIEIDDICLVMLDADIIGLIYVLLYHSKDGKLNQDKLNYLVNCKSNLDLILDKIEGEGKLFFDQLNNLVERVLKYMDLKK